MLATSEMYLGSCGRSMMELHGKIVYGYESLTIFTKAFHQIYWSYIRLYPLLIKNYLADIYRFKVNNKNIRTMCEICSKLAVKTVKIPERHQ